MIHFLLNTTAEKIRVFYRMHFFLSFITSFKLFKVCGRMSQYIVKKNTYYITVKLPYKKEF